MIVCIVVGGLVLYFVGGYWITWRIITGGWRGAFRKLDTK